MDMSVEDSGDGLCRSGRINKGKAPAPPDVEPIPALQQRGKKCSVAESTGDSDKTTCHAVAPPSCRVVVKSPPEAHRPKQHIRIGEDGQAAEPVLSEEQDTGALEGVWVGRGEMFTKDPIPSEPYRAMMDAGFNPNTPAQEATPAPEITHNTQYGEVMAAGSPVRAGLSNLMKRYIREASANLKAIHAAKTPNCLPQETRHIIREAAELRVSQPAPRATPEDLNWVDEDGTVERIKNELMVELGRDVSDLQTGYTNFYLGAPLQLHKDNDYPCSNEGFNLSTALVIVALDSGVEDNRGDLEQAGMIPSSWFRLTSAVLGAILREALQSGGCKIQGRVKIDDDDADVWRLAEGAEEPPLSEFYDSVLHVGQNHIEKVVHLKAAATYQVLIADAKGLADMVYDDMARQTYDYMITNKEARRKANQRSLDRLFVEAQEQLSPFIGEWKSLYKHHLVQALIDDEEAREDAPPVMDPLLHENEGYIKLFAYNRAKELRESIARMVTDPILDGDEITHARERIWLDHAEEIEAARQDTHAQISSEKKAWAVAYRDSVKLDWLTKAAEELGYILVSKDDAEEREGRTAKCHAGPVVPATPENQLKKLDTLQTPKARKTKVPFPIITTLGFVRCPRR
ncbi:hypothetical protein BJY52DRAFT_1230250 [Lactarius psammicola]|nr:hypothetical protein BJY52DRAFT_1230250 [Lactarius psammicola]